MFVIFFINECHSAVYSNYIIFLQKMCALFDNAVVIKLYIGCNVQICVYMMNRKNETVFDFTCV